MRFLHARVESEDVKAVALAVPLVFFPRYSVCTSAWMDDKQESQASEPTPTLSPPTSEESSFDHASLQSTPRTGYGPYGIVQRNGQRRYGPPPDWGGPPPPQRCEIFVGKIPRDLFEDKLVPVLENIYAMRFMMDFSMDVRGCAFVVGICTRVDNCCLFVGGIPNKVCIAHSVVVVYMCSQDGHYPSLMLIFPVRYT